MDVSHSPTDTTLPRAASSRLLWSLGVAAWVAAGVWLGWAFHHPTALFFDLGWGDSATAGREFQGDWWRYEVRGTTAYRWTGSQARISSPVSVRGRDLTIEWRCARFAAGGTPVTLAAGGRTLARWEQGPQDAWDVRRASLGAHAGGLAIDVRASRDSPRPHGIALDWVRIVGVESVWPERGTWAGIACLIVGVPLVLAIFSRRAWPLVTLGPVLAVALGAAVLCDTVAAIAAFGVGGPRALLATTAVGGGGWLLRRLRVVPRVELDLAVALWVPTVTVVLASLALSSPRYDYPDVETHGRYLSGIRKTPRWAVDPRPYQRSVRAWTRVVDGERVGFPYSSVFHVLSWPLAPELGDVGSIVTVACMAVGSSVLLLHVIGLVSGLAPPGAVVAQAFFAVLPVISSRLTLALWPSLLGQCLELVVLTLVMTRPIGLEGAGGRARWVGVLLVAQVGYVGGLLDVSAVVLVAALAAVTVGDWRWAGRLAACQAAAGAIIVLGQHWYFLATLWKTLIPALGRGGGGGVGAESGLAGEVHELAGFFGGGIVLLGAGAWLWRRVAARPRKVVAAVVGGAALLSIGRALAPTLLGDAKVVELLAMPVALGMSWGFTGLWTASRRWRAVALGGSVAFVVWSAIKAYQLYAFHAMVALL